MVFEGRGATAAGIEVNRRTVALGAEGVNIGGLVYRLPIIKRQFVIVDGHVKNPLVGGSVPVDLMTVKAGHCLGTDVCSPILGTAKWIYKIRYHGPVIQPWQASN